jgi:NAD(P)-dependent dehydrogenase (short-subunit alcohol dehydrogenase family)
MLNVNLRGAMLCSHYVLPAMFKQKHGCIVNVGSVVGSGGQAGVVAYSAAKSGLIGGYQIRTCFRGCETGVCRVSLKDLQSPWPRK